MYSLGSRTPNYKHYAYALVVTMTIFATAFYASGYFNAKRITEIRGAQDDISTDILSIETQFDLLQEYKCTDVAESTILPSALSSLGSQLSYMEAQHSSSAAEVTRLKRLYSLLEIKDYLLMKQIASKCALKPTFILYFYSNKGDCADCEKQGYVLTALAKKYPMVRIYSFDYNLDVSALRTLTSITRIKNNLPALRVNGINYYGLQTVENIEDAVPSLTQTIATSTRIK